MRRGLWTKTGEISIQIRFEFIEQDFQFRIVKLSRRRNVRRIDNHRAELSDLRDQIVHYLVGGVVEAERLAHNSQARALQAVWIEKPGVVSECFALTVAGDFVARINPGQSAEHDRRIRDRATKSPATVRAK